MKGHRFDALSFVFGVIFLAISGTLSYSNFHLNTKSVGWIAAGVLIMAGGALLAGSWTGSKNRP